MSLLSFFSNAQGRVEPFVVLFASPLFLVSALAVMAAMNTAYWLTHYYRAGAETPDLRVLGGCIFLGIWLSTLATSRADFSHILYITPLFAYLLAVVPRHSRPPFAYTLFCSACHCGYSSCPRLSGFVSRFLKAVGLTKRLKTRRREIRAAYDDQVIPYVQGHMAEGEYLFVHPYQPLYSFLTGSTPSSRFDGIQSAAPDTVKIIAEDLSRP